MLDIYKRKNQDITYKPQPKPQPQPKTSYDKVRAEYKRMRLIEDIVLGIAVVLIAAVLIFMAVTTPAPA